MKPNASFRSTALRCFVHFLKGPMLHLFIFHQILSWRSSSKQQIHFISRKQIYKSISPSDYSALQKRYSFHLECILPLEVPHCGHFHISIFHHATRSQINYPRKKRPLTSAGSLVSAGYYRGSIRILVLEEFIDSTETQEGKKRSFLNLVGLLKASYFSNRQYRSKVWGHLFISALNSLLTSFMK